LISCRTLTCFLSSHRPPPPRAETALLGLLGEGVTTGRCGTSRATLPGRLRQLVEIVAPLAGTERRIIEIVFVQLFDERRIAAEEMRVPNS
jgi:hypothetical protein